MGSEREWITQKGQLRLTEVKHYGHFVDFSSSVKVSTPPQSGMIKIIKSS